jgi:hypothetical protein
MAMRPTFLLAMVATVLTGLPADETTTGAGRAAAAEQTGFERWTEVRWPFAVDQWGKGRAFECAAAYCGTAITLYLRPKIGFCNCSTGVSDDAELDRVGDLELLGSGFIGVRDGRPVSVGWMRVRSRPYGVAAISPAASRHALVVAFNDKCDVVVATVSTEGDGMTGAERAALDLLESNRVLRWIERELGI